MAPETDAEWGEWVTLADYEFLKKRFASFVLQVGGHPAACICRDEEGLPLMQCDGCPR
jgi:hypothetical protein